MAERADQRDDDRTNPLQRIRAILGIAVLVVVLGVATAGTIGIVVLGVASFVDQALE